MEPKISKSGLKLYLNVVSKGLISDIDIWVQSGIYNTLWVPCEIDYSVIPSEFENNPTVYMNELGLEEKVFDFLKMMGVPRYINKIELVVVNRPDGGPVYDFGY